MQWKKIGTKTISKISHTPECAETPLEFDELIIAANDLATKSWVRLIMADNVIDDDSSQKSMTEAVMDALQLIQRRLLEHADEVEAADESIVWRRIARCFDKKIAKYEAKLKKRHH